MLIIISGPSGSGKGTVVNRLCPKGADSEFAVSISVTTRAPREGEIDGANYFFRSKREFHELLSNGELLESAMFCGHYYGTPSGYVGQMLDAGKNVVLEIEVNGALQVKKKLPECALIFLLPPTIAELKRRLAGRASETAESQTDRLRRAREEIKLIDQYDYLVINDDVDEAVANIRTIVRAEKLKPLRSGFSISKWRNPDA
jgi:guanylate kinase